MSLQMRGGEALARRKKSIGKERWYEKLWGIEDTGFGKLSSGTRMGHEAGRS